MSDEIEFRFQGTVTVDQLGGDRPPLYCTYVGIRPISLEWIGDRLHPKAPPLEIDDVTDWSGLT